MIPGEIITLAADPAVPKKEITDITIWEPQNCLPWRAERKGTDEYIWYVIKDSYGSEIFSTCSMRDRGDEHDDFFRMVCKTLVEVNGSPEIQINDKKFTVQWGIERIRLEEIV